MRWIVLLVALSLSGCFGGDSEPDSSGGPETDPGTDPGTDPVTDPGSSPDPDPGTNPDQEPGPDDGNQTASNETNLPPAIQIEVVADAGGAMINVTLSDPDGDLMDWQLIVDQTMVASRTGAANGSVEQHYESAGGTHTYEAEVSDGNKSVSINGTFEVLASAGSQSVSGSQTAGLEGCGPALAMHEAGTVPLASSSPTNGVTRVQFAVEAATIGNDYRIDWTFDVGYIAMYIFWTDGDGDIVAQTVDEAPNTGNWGESGTVPDAAYLVMFACAGPSSAEYEYSA